MKEFARKEDIDALWTAVNRLIEKVQELSQDGGAEETNEPAE